MATQLVCIQLVCMQKERLLSFSAERNNLVFVSNDDDGDDDDEDDDDDDQTPGRILTMTWYERLAGCGIPKKGTIRISLHRASTLIIIRSLCQRKKGP